MAETASHSWLGVSSTGRNQGRRQEGRFEDVLTERRTHSDLSWAFKTFDPTQYRFGSGKALTPAQIKDAVRNSDNVKYSIKKLSEELSMSEKDLQIETELILQEMGHNLTLRTVRSVGYFLCKIMKSLYRNVFVNREGIEQLRAAIKEYPVVLLPSHRSYADFLLMSYICYDYALPLPVIAAAMDFMNMNFFGEVLRNCGAFFIRRSFASDRLYWLLFTEYVKFHVRLGQHPVEFYLEGTRSRTAKSLPPKTGMLGSILESWFVGQVPDVYLVPINISHDRILEESLYAYELLGIPKPKESASGLLKARHILDQDFGSVHLYFSKPVSLRQLAEGHIDRGLHNLQCRFSVALFPEEIAFIKRVSHEMVIIQQQFAVVAPWCLYATSLLVNPAGVQAGQLVEEAHWFRSLLTNLGACVSWPVSTSGASAQPLEVLRDQLQLHKDLIMVTRRQHLVNQSPLPPRGPLLEDDQIEPLFSRHLTPAVSSPRRSLTPIQLGEPRGELLEGAALGIQMASYRNQLMHIVIKEAILASLINSRDEHGEIEQETLKSQYVSLETLLCREFIVESSDENFATALRNMVHMGGVVLKNSEENVRKPIDTVKSQTRHTAFLARILEPFLIGYWLVTGHFLYQISPANKLNNTATEKNGTQNILSKLGDRDWAKRVQSIGFALVGQDPRFRFEICSLSLDLLTNAVSSLRKQNLIPQDTSNSSNVSSARQGLESIHSLLGNILGDSVTNIEMDKFWQLEKVPLAKV